MDQMQTIETKMTYQEFKGKFDRAVNGAVEDFVEIGFYLKYARDTDVLAESPYQTIAEYAKAEYGMDKSTTSRFIAINDRFAEGGYSNKLKEQYRSFGYTKLALMLTLPEEITEELSPLYSKAEIQAIKDEVDEEKAISDLEVMMEPRPVPAPAKGLLNQLIYQLGEDSPDLYVQMAGITAPDLQEWTRKAKEILAPDAEKQYAIRISGTGRFMLSIRETEDTITVTALRTLEKRYYNYQKFQEAWEEILPPNGTPDTDWSERDMQNGWEITYKREYPGKVKVAPVQQSGKPKKTESKPPSRKESKVQKAQKPAQAKAAPPLEEKQSAPEPEILESTSTEEQAGMEAADNKTVTYCHKLEEKSKETGMEQLEEQLPGQIGMEEAIADAEERNGAVSHIEPDDNPVMAADQLDKEWEKEKIEFLDDLKRLDTEGSLLSRNLSQIPYVHIAAFRTSMINMAALIEKELLRRGKSF